MHVSGQATMSESELLERVLQPVPAALQRRFDALIARRQQALLTPDEHRELLRLTELFELRDAERVEFLVALARMRDTTLASLMREIGIDQPVPHD